MDNKYMGDGLTVQWTNGTGGAVESGDVVLLGDQGLVGVCVEDIANGSTGSVMLPPGLVVKTPVKGHDGSSNGAVAQYDKVYFTSGDAFCDADDSATLAGYTLEAVGSGNTTTVQVLVCRA